MCELNVVAGDERVECFGEPRVQRDGPSALRAGQTLEGRADVGIPDDLEAQPLAVHAAEVDEPRWRRELA